MASTTGSVQFSNVTQLPVGERTVGNNSRFAPVTRQDIENVLIPLGFQAVMIEGTNELVFAKRVGPYSLRVLTGCNPDGSPRPRGTDAIRTQLWKRGQDDLPVRVRGAKRTMRVHTWRRNLIRKVEQLTAWGMDNCAPQVQPKTQGNPTCPLCGGATTDPKQGRKGWFHGCRSYPKCRGLVAVAK